MNKISKILITTTAIASVAVFSISTAQAEQTNCTLPGTWVGCKVDPRHILGSDEPFDVNATPPIIRGCPPGSVAVVVNIDQTDRYGNEISLDAAHSFPGIPDFRGAGLKQGYNYYSPEFQFRAFSMPKPAPGCFATRGVMKADLPNCTIYFREQVTMGLFKTLDAPSPKATCGGGGPNANIVARFFGVLHKLNVAEWPPHPVP